MTPMIAGYACAYGVQFHDDILQHGAFAALLAGGFKPLMLLGHKGGPIGRWLEFKEDDTGLHSIGRIDMTKPRGRLALDMVEAGEITGLSLGKFAGEARPIGTGRRLCRRVLRCPEISLVTHPENPAARLLSYCAGTA
ncbi:HK97 family phage prohead protease [Mesorhizobium abyssinicae]|uniref:HK97 family phage prohead protease n=1 Tax=Mesorhizobium abyssinicae TaxID=1209958 RepID=UPI00339A1483